jgi:drug/metabolite transporter (DMT)-like permease
MLIPLALIQSLLLVAGQVFLKLALARMPQASFSFAFVKALFCDVQFALAGICFGAGTVLWFYILKHYPLSSAYPLLSLSYVFGMIASIVVFHESVDSTKWIGTLLIMFGCYLIAK